jgi:hypothetical protein
MSAVSRTMSEGDALTFGSRESTVDRLQTLDHRIFRHPVEP